MNSLSDEFVSYLTIFFSYNKSDNSTLKKTLHACLRQEKEDTRTDTDTTRPMANGFAHGAAGRAGAASRRALGRPAARAVAMMPNHTSPYCGHHQGAALLWPGKRPARHSERASGRVKLLGGCDPERRFV